MKVQSVCLVTLIGLSAVLSTAGVGRCDQYLPSFTLTPRAGQGLVEAVSLFKCEDKTPPRCLAAYTVLLLEHKSDIQVIFQENEGLKSFVAIVPDGGTATIEPGGTPTVDAPPIVLPGTTAGAVAMAWTRVRQAAGGAAILAKLLRIEVFIEPGTSVVVFFPQLPNSSQKCIAGNCEDRWGYRIRLVNGETTISP